MAIRLLTLVDQWGRGESARLGPDDARRVLGSEVTLLRLWDAPDDSDVSQYLVVQGAPRLSLFEDAIEGAGLSLHAVLPIVPSQSGQHWARTESEIVSSLPEFLPRTLVDPPEARLEMSPLPVLGLVACGVCGGLGGHIYQHA